MELKKGGKNNMRDALHTIVPMREMTYSSVHKYEILFWERYVYFDDDNNKHEENILILNYGTHPCAYIQNSDAKLTEDEALNLLDVHGGITFYGSLGGFSGTYYGWDYAHYNDYMGYNERFPSSYYAHERRWTTQEILTEAREAMLQLKKAVTDNDVE